MTQLGFIDAIIMAYGVARNFIGNNMGGKIQRCRSHSVSSVAEDILASYVFDLVHTKGYTIYVDCPISIPAINGGKVKTYYPDIVVCNETENGCEIKYLIDLKMDAGWFRNDIDKMVKAHDDVVGELLKASTVQPPVCITDNKQNKIVVNISPALRYDIVIITAVNGGKNYCSKVSSANGLNLKSRIYTLTVREHPNKQPLPEVKPHPEFSCFDNYCKSL